MVRLCWKVCSRFYRSRFFQHLKTHFTAFFDIRIWRHLKMTRSGMIDKLVIDTIGTLLHPSKSNICSFLRTTESSIFCKLLPQVDKNWSWKNVGWLVARKNTLSPRRIVNAPHAHTAGVAPENSTGRLQVLVGRQGSRGENLRFCLLGCS